MKDLIKMNPEEERWIVGLLPKSEENFHLYRQPALEEFCIEYRCEDTDLTADFSFERIENKALSQIVGREPEASFDHSAAILCKTKMLFTKRNAATTIWTVFGFTIQHKFCCETVKADSEEDRNFFASDYAKTTSRLYEGVQYLLLHHRELLQFSVANQPNKHSGKKKKGGKSKKTPPQKTRLYRLVHLTDEQTDELKKSIHEEYEKRKMERHCSAWGVRGHYRHYKSGKVAYIKPHVRGKEKGSYQGREYVLLPKDILNQQPE